jgi:hypothetical protein
MLYVINYDSLTTSVHVCAVRAQSVQSVAGVQSVHSPCTSSCSPCTVRAQSVQSVHVRARPLSPCTSVHVHSVSRDVWRTGVWAKNPHTHGPGLEALCPLEDRNLDVDSYPPNQGEQRLEREEPNLAAQRLRTH